MERRTTDQARWGCAALALAVVLALLDWVSTAAPRATLLVLCLLVIGGSLLVSDAIATRRGRAPADDDPGSRLDA